MRKTLQFQLQVALHFRPQFPIQFYRSVDNMRTYMRTVGEDKVESDIEVFFS